MCQFISFFHNPTDGEISVAVADLNSHANTEKELKLNLKIWREGHYLSNGKIELRMDGSERISQKEYEERFLQRWPTFIEFFNWCLKKINAMESFSGSLSLNGLTSATGLVLPKEVGDYLDLSGLTSATGLVLPKVCYSLHLNRLTSATGLVLPKVCGSLDLGGLTSATGLVLPKVCGSLDLGRLTSATSKKYLGKTINLKKGIIEIVEMRRRR